MLELNFIDSKKNIDNLLNDESNIENGLLLINEYCKLKYLEPILIDYLPEVLNFASYKKNENVRIQACITA